MRLIFPSSAYACVSQFEPAQSPRWWMVNQFFMHIFICAANLVQRKDVSTGTKSKAGSISHSTKRAAENWQIWQSNFFAKVIMRLSQLICIWIFHYFRSGMLLLHSLTHEIKSQCSGSSCHSADNNNQHRYLFPMILVRSRQIIWDGEHKIMRFVGRIHISTRGIKIPWTFDLEKMLKEATLMLKGKILFHKYILWQSLFYWIQKKQNV